MSYNENDEYDTYYDENDDNYGDNYYHDNYDDKGDDKFHVMPFRFAKHSLNMNGLRRVIRAKDWVYMVCGLSGTISMYLPSEIEYIDLSFSGNVMLSPFVKYTAKWWFDSDGGVSPGHVNHDSTFSAKDSNCRLNGYNNHYIFKHHKSAQQYVKLLKRKHIIS